MKVVFRPASLVLLTFALGFAPQLGAAPLSIDAPSFIIPIGGESGTLTLFSDGRAPETTGFNALGRQRLTLQGNSVSSGMLTLNLHFSGFDVDEETFDVSAASLRLNLRDLDFMPERVRTGTYLQESATLSAINGVPLTTPLLLDGYLPGGTGSTANRVVALNPLLFEGTNLPASFAGPLVLTFTLTATLANNASSPVTINNSREHIASDISLTVVPATIPEPSTYALLGVGVLWLAFTVRRRR